MNGHMDFRLSNREAKTLLIIITCLQDYKNYENYPEWVRNEVDAIRLKLKDMEIEIS